MVVLPPQRRTTEDMVRAMDDDTGGLRERGKQRRVQRILDAGLQLLRENPEAALTVDRIAQRAEVAPATVFNLIGPRERIWTALAQHAIAGIQSAPSQHDDPQDRARGLIDPIIKVAVEDAAVFRTLWSDWALSAKVFDQDLVDGITACLRDANFATLDVHRMAALVAAGLNGLCHQWAAGMITDDQLRSRSGDFIDVAFVAARGAEMDPRPRWRLQRKSRRRANDDNNSPTG
jgi:AcrR family transcriptional regulator